MRVEDIIAAKPHQEIYSVKKSSSIDAAVSELSNRKVGALIVSDDGKILDGILSERDIIREMGKRGTACLGDNVGDLMTGTVSCCAKSDTADKVLETMTEGRFRHMPILDGGKIIGLISIGDVVKARLDDMARENSAMVDMIRGL
mgnify:FL=1